MAAPRFSILPGRAAADERMTLSVLRVLSALGRHTNAEGWCFINQGRLARELGVSRQAVNSAVRKLVEWGYLEKRATRRKDGGNGVCDYRVKLDQQSDAEPEEVSTGDDTPLSSPEVTGGVKPEGDRPLSTLEFTTGTTHEGTTQSNDSEVDLWQEFLGWWEHVIRKEGRKAAWGKYQIARRKHSAETLLDGMQRYSAHCRAKPETETRFIKQPATWLHGEHWSDELTPKDGKPPALPIHMPGVLIGLRHPARKKWIEYWGNNLKLLPDAAFKVHLYAADRAVREDTEYPPDYTHTEAAE